MKTKQQRRESAIARNARYRSKYEAECRAANPEASNDEVRAYADMKQGVPKIRHEQLCRC